MILVINICKEKLHYYEFVKPIEDILETNNMKYFTKHYKEIKNNDLKKADKVIICGTSLKDNEFMQNIKLFSWVKDFNKPILGICGGMHIVHSIYGAKKQKKLQIGIISVNFKDNFLSIKGEKQVYNLHQYYFATKEFLTYDKQASKHLSKPIYGVLFHPEVRNKDLITNFIRVTNENS